MTHSSDDRWPVVIIGGGLAGLSAAAHLTARGVPVMLLESDRQWAGGRLSGGEPEHITHKEQDWTFKPEHGVHGVWGGYVNMRALIERFTNTRLIPSGGEEWINRWGQDVRRIEAGNAIRARWIPAPFHMLNLLLHPQIWATITPLDFLSLPGYLVSVLLTTGLDPIKEKRPLNGLTLIEYFRGWTPNLKATFRGLAANLMAAPEDRVTLTGFVAALRFYTMLRRDSWAMAYLPADSHTALIQPLMDHITAHDGDIRQGVTATRLTRHGDGWCVTVDDQVSRGERSVYADHVILATSAPAAKRLLTNSPDTATEAAHLTFPDGLANAVVRLWFDTEPRAGTSGGMFTGDFVPDNFFWLHRLYDDYRAWHEATGGACIELHFYETRHLDTPDAHLIALATTDVQRAFPELRGAFLHGTVRRNSKLHTAFTVPSADSLQVDTPWPNLTACGDWIGFDTPSLWMERATTTGIGAANVILRARGLEPYPILYPPPPELAARIVGGVVRMGRKVSTPVIRLLRRR